eukprot:Amastigsp_a11594_4.p4 type:complete len:111 gc:universal Amastigsp_a11594_4:653-321(-)
MAAGHMAELGAATGDSPASAASESSVVAWCITNESPCAPLERACSAKNSASASAAVRRSQIASQTTAPMMTTRLSASEKRTSTLRPVAESSVADQRMAMQTPSPIWSMRL